MQNNQKVKYRIAVLMTCYNRKDTTSRCLTDLASLHPDPTVQVDIFLVDDGSTDGTGSAIRKNYPYVNVIDGDGDLFWNRGTHLAFSKAISSGNYDFFLWLNDDTHLYPSALQTILKTYEKLRDIGYSDAIVGGATQEQDTKAFTYGGVIRHKAWYGLRFERVWSRGGEAVQCDATNGNCVLIPRAVVDKVGNLDTRFKHRWGDQDYCFRALEKGCTIWLAPGFIGACSCNPVKGTWKDDQLPLLNRIRLLWAPSGLLPNDYWVYLKRHRGGLWFLFWLAPFVQIFLSAAKGSFRSRSSEPESSVTTEKGASPPN
jgi:GT2 family glycosyltransferase